MSAATAERTARTRAAEFHWPVRVYYEDTDAAGIVYHANFLKYMERARTEWLRAIGYDQDRLRREQGIVFVITHCDIAFLRPARFNDELVATVRIARCGRASLEFAQAVVDGAGRPLCRGRVRVGCVAIAAMKPCAMPRQMFVEIHHAI